jgi:hypothetical protein
VTEEDAPEGRRRIPSTWGGVVYLVIATLVVIGLAVVAYGPWRRGVTLIGVAGIAAAVARGALPQREAGMLEVRGRWFDVTSLVGVGTTLIVLAAVIPDQPG